MRCGDIQTQPTNLHALCHNHNGASQRGSKGRWEIRESKRPASHPCLTSSHFVSLLHLHRVRRGRREQSTSPPVMYESPQCGLGSTAVSYVYEAFFFFFVFLGTSCYSHSLLPNSTNFLSICFNDFFSCHDLLSQPVGLCFLHLLFLARTFLHVQTLVRPIISTATARATKPSF